MIVCLPDLEFVLEQTDQGVQSTVLQGGCKTPQIQIVALDDVAMSFAPPCVIMPSIIQKGR